MTVQRYFRKTERGAAAVEFAVASTLFFTVLFGILYFGLALFYWNSAAEATRNAARVAVVCNPNSTALVTAKMQQLVPQLSSAQVSLTYSPSGCDVNTCRTVTVSVTNYTLDLPLPLPIHSMAMPPFTTTLTRESLNSTNNSVCS
ncbi:MAG: pilus assembly protein TadG [Rhodocyclaceae bacterium]|nr:pilus assembly protein TadG [Rhodocyclaceae bacterium]